MLARIIIAKKDKLEPKAVTISRGIFLDFFAAQHLTKMASVRQAKKIVLYLAVIPDAGSDSPAGLAHNQYDSSASDEIPNPGGKFG
ncbi:MAG: hypothetical protein OES12_04260 [Anaerolineae bacterium]|nr:hypothetical protein [Anaerolineae bacterium]